MTLLGKPINRQLPRMIERREWIVSIDAVGISFREKRHQRKTVIGWDAVFNRAMDIAAEEIRRERRAARSAQKRRAA